MAMTPTAFFTFDERKRQKLLQDARAQANANKILGSTNADLTPAPPPSTAAASSASTASAELAAATARKRASAGNTIAMKGSTGGAANPRAGLAAKTLLGGY